MNTQHEDDLQEIEALLSTYRWSMYNLTTQGMERIEQDTDHFYEAIRRIRAAIEAQQVHAEESNVGDTDVYQHHQYCTVCRECVTCNLRPCRDGGTHSGGTVPSVVENQQI